METIITAAAIVALVLALWHAVNLSVFLMTWIGGHLISSDKKIVMYLVFVSLVSLLGFGGGCWIFVMLLPK